MRNRSRRRRLALATASLAALLTLGIAAEARADTGVVGATTYLRVGPGREYAVLDEIEPGNRLDVRSCQGNWCQVSVGGVSGYVEAASLHGPDIHRPAPQQQVGSDCFPSVLNGRRGGDHERFCTR